MSIPLHAPGHEQHADIPPPSSPVTPEALRMTMGIWTTGCAVITAVDDDGPLGIVSNSLTSVSLEPPLVSWCVATTSSNHQRWRSVDSWAVHILAEGQDDLIARFARKGVDKFADLLTGTGTTGAPLIPGSAALLECRAWARYHAGDHALLIGHVLALHHEAVPPLVHGPRTR